MTARSTLRAAGTAALVALMMLPTTPVLAAVRSANLDDGQRSGPGLSVLQTIGLFVVIPVALYLLIWALVSAPAMTRGPRYRPGLGWWSAPVWFNGPDDAETAVRAASPTTGGGGASARW